MRRNWLWHKRRRGQDWLTRDLDNAEHMLRVTRWFARFWPRHEFDLCSVLLDYARRLTEAGRRADAVSALDEAIEIGGKHVRAKPVRFAPNLAAALLMRAHLLAGLGRQDEALSSAEGAVDIYRTLVPGDPDRFEPALFSATTSVGFWRHRRGEFEAALPAFETAAELARRLPPARANDRAMAFNNLGAVLMDLGRFSAAVTPFSDAATLRRELAAGDRERFEQDLVASLRNLEHTLSALGRYVEAVGVADELTALTRSSSPAADGEPGPS